MHPVFANTGKNQAIPILFVYAANFDAVRKKLGSSEQAFISTAAFEAKPGRSLLLPAVTASLPGSCSESKAPTTRTATGSGRDNWPVFCRRAPTVSPTGRTTYGSPH